MNTIDDKISQLSPRKKAMFEKLLREKLLQQTQTTSEIKSITREDNRYPLSYAQEKIWVANALNPGTILYNMVGVTRAQGEARIPSFIEGLKAAFNKHEILRMNFKKEGDTAYARINEAAYFEPIIHDYSQKPHDREAVIEDVMNQVARKPFDIEKETLIRVALICTAQDDWTIILVIHHIIGDGISINIILGEALEYRHNKLKNIESEIKQFPIQFKDYAWWEKNKERDTEAEKNSEVYWQTKLEGANFSLDLLKTKQDGMAFNNLAHRQDFSLDTKMVKDIQVIAQKEKVTAFSIYLTALKLLIYKYSMQEDLVLGVVTFGRDLAEVSHMIGCFVDILPIRSAIDAQMTFLEFTKLVYQNFLENYQKKDAYFKQEQQSNPQFLFNYKESSEVKTKIDGLELNSQEINSGYSRVPMEFDLIKSGEEIAGGITYRDGVLNEAFIQAFIERYILILNALINEPTAYLNKKVSEITLITQAEETLILTSFNDMTVDYPKNKTVVELFEEQVKKTPNHIAITFQGRQLTYKELNEKSNQLAYLLGSKGIGRESLVGILSERSLEMIIGIYGIVKAGGAYVPLDPTYPAERIAYMVEDCDFKLVLTYQAKIETEKETLDLGDSKLYEGMSKENLSLVNMPDDLIYVIYTSGTTGKPKGVMVEHKNVINLVKHTNYVKLDEETAILQTGSMSFDASTFELWGATLNGGKLVLIPHGILLNTTLLKEEIIKNEINTMFVTVTLYNQLIDVDISMFDSLKYLLIGGEAVSEEHVRKLVGRNAELNFSNDYGPTENTTFSLYYPITAETLREKTPIGRPISNTQAYIMNGSNLCGIGIPGELCVAGDGVARGYLNQPEMTSAKFIDNPYGKGKLYRSGDLARWLEDGNIEYLGRIDDQVKIRGFRIELGEIESVLRNQVDITDCAVIVREDATGDKGLYGYVISDVELDISTLRDHLANELPNYMIPSYMMQIDKLPLSPTGKLDKRALPEITATADLEYVAPRSDMEEKVCEAFAKVLKVERVGIHDGFFQLGGHSLRALKLVNLLEELTGKSIQVKHIFETGEVWQLAKLLENLDEVKYERIPEADEQKVYEMSSTQKRMYLLWRLNPADVIYNIPVMLKLKHSIDEAKLQGAFKTLMERHEILRTTFHEKEAQLIQVISDMKSTNVLVEHLKEAELTKWYQESIVSFDLETGPAYRIKVARTGQNDYLFVDMHHIISDEISIVLFVKEFTQLIKGDELPLLDRQYKDYSEWAKQQDFSISKEYWIDSLQNYPVLELPSDFMRPKEQQFSGATEILILDEEVTKQIKQLLQRHRVTEYIFFLGLISILLGKLSNQEELVIGTPVSGRTHKDTEQMLGMFVNTLAIRVSPSGDKSFASYLAELKEQVLMAQEHQTYPFEDLVGHVAKKRDLSRHPIFDVMVSYQNSEIFLALSEIGEWQRFDEANEDVAKFDLNFTVADDGKQIKIELNYATALFKKNTIHVYLKRLLKLLNHVLMQDQAD